jgi:hypothetical protein
MKVAIVQPYSFPYIGYFQLVNEVDVFVFYDDVHFIKKGWIHRNNILVNGNSSLFTIPLVKPSQNSLINEIGLSIDAKWRTTFNKKLHHSYGKAPYFNGVMELIEPLLNTEYNNISLLAIESIVSISNYLGLNTKFKVSSKDFNESRGMDRADRLIEITKSLGGNIYINPSGGKELYTKEYFNSKSIELKFIESEVMAYKQFENVFCGGLSIIDVLMFNSVESINKMIEQYKLV